MDFRDNTASRVLLATAVVGMCACASRAQTTSTAQPVDSRAIKSPPAYTPTKQVPEEMISGPKRQVIILSSQPGEPGGSRAERSGGAIGTVSPELRRLPEGYILANRPVQIEQEEGWYLAYPIHVENLPDTAPLRILPNQRLAVLEAILSGDAHTTTFVITGRVTEFQGGNYLLIEKLMESSSRPDESNASLKPIATMVGSNMARSTPFLGQEGPGASLLKIGDAPVNTVSSSGPSPKEVIAHLMKERPLKAVVLSDDAPAVIPRRPVEEFELGDEMDHKPASESQTTVDDSVLPEGTLLVDRTARVVTGDPWWMLTFEDRGYTPRDRPLRLIPNQLLETALALSGAGTRAMVFVISGEVTLHKRTNYLLLRKVLVRRNLGNLH